MWLTIILTLVAFFVGGWTAYFMNRRKMRLLNSELGAAVNSSNHNFKLARLNYEALETQKKFTRDVERLFWVAWFMALFCWFMWRRESRKNSGQ